MNFMEPYRARPEIAPQEVKLLELTDSGNREEAVTSEPEFKPQDTLDMWEKNNGQYGLEYLGIKEIAKDFTQKMQFSTLDKYIKAEMDERGYDKTPKNWQDILGEIENEIGSKGLSAYDRLKKLNNYVKVLQKFKAAKKLKESYANLSSDSK